MLTELLAQYLPGKRCRIIAGGNRMGEHPPAPILDAELAINNGPRNGSGEPIRKAEPSH